MMNATPRRVLTLLPVLSEAGVRALICPVSLGRLGEHRGGKVDPADIRPLWPEKPVVFTVVAHLDAEHDRWERERMAAIAAEAELADAMAQTRWLDRRRRRELTEASAAARARQQSAQAASRACRSWADTLRASLPATPVYFGGEPGMGVEHE